MIDEETKEKLIEELTKTGNIYLACGKLRISRASFYRFRRDLNFKKRANIAIRCGRDNTCGMVEGFLILKAKTDLGAMKYFLGHNSPKYKPSPNNKIIFEHRRGVEKKADKQKSWRDVELEAMADMEKIKRKQDQGSMSNEEYDKLIKKIHVSDDPENET
jgi:hypothetical protein